MPGLLVSVRSAAEARAAVAGGAAVIDVKDPGRGPLGRADDATIAAVRAAVPDHLPVSAALGELGESGPIVAVPPGVRFRKLGLAGSGPGWERAWAVARRSDPGGPAWVAVAYADWGAAGAPGPDAVLAAALLDPTVVGVLVDTWDKTRPCPLDATPAWAGWVARAREAGLFVTLAGRLDRAAIDRLRPLDPDLFAVRGAACDRGDRRGEVRAELVAGLARAVDPDGIWSPSALAGAVVSRGQSGILSASMIEGMSSKSEKNGVIPPTQVYRS